MVDSEALRVLSILRNNPDQIIMRAGVGVAMYEPPGFRSSEVTSILRILIKKDLIEIDRHDERVGWVWYRPTKKGLARLKEKDEQTTN